MQDIRSNLVINGIGCRRCVKIDDKKNLLKERNAVLSLEKRMREVNLSSISNI